MGYTFSRSSIHASVRGPWSSAVSLSFTIWTGWCRFRPMRCAELQTCAWAQRNGLHTGMGDGLQMESSHVRLRPGRAFPLSRDTHCGSQRCLQGVRVRREGQLASPYLSTTMAQAFPSMADARGKEGRSIRLWLSIPFGRWPDTHSLGLAWCM